MKSINPEISLPRGVSDFLPDTAAKIDYIESKVRRVFELWGFRRVITPKLEYEEVMAIGMGDQLKGKTYRFDDRQTGKLLAFPPDITPQIARIVATRMASFPLPLRLSYSGRVLRQTESQAGRSREFFQSGVELIGLDSPEADAEMIVMAIESLQSLGIDGFTIDIGQVEFCRAVLVASGLEGDALKVIKEAISRKDSSAVAQILEIHQVSAESRRELSALPRLFGDRKVLDEAAKTVKNQCAAIALKNLQDVLSILDMHGVSKYLTFDLGETRGLDYHTGITFEGFVTGLGESVCSGGRYDNLTARYSFPASATGFTFNLLALLQALEHKPELQATVNHDFLLFNRCDDLRVALDVAHLLRRRGYTAARDIICRDYNHSLEYARRMNIRIMLVIEDKQMFHAVRVSDGVTICTTMTFLETGNINNIFEENRGE